MHYIDEGSGPETIVFSHGLLFSGEMFAKQIDHLKDRYRCIAFDHRGQGGSPATKTGYDIDTLTDDAINLIENLNVGPCHFVGLSMGGFVGMRIAFRRPELLKSLTLIGTSADPEPVENLPRYKMLRLVARWFGLRVVDSQAMQVMFGQTFLNDPSRADERRRWANFIANNRRRGVTRALTGVIEREGVYDEIAQIEKPTLILVGEEDAGTTPDKSERMHRQIAGSKLVIIPVAGHSTTIERPEAVNFELDKFLSEVATSRV